MQDTVSKLIARFIAKLPAAPGATLYVQKAQPGEDNLKAPWHTVLVHGRHDESDQPLAVVLMTAPFQAADAPAVLKFVVRRARAHKAPYFVSLCELVGERTTLGLMRAKVRKTKARGVKAEKKVVEEVLDEVLPDGPKRFPDDFLSGAAATATRTHVELLEARLVFDNSPLFAGVHSADNTVSRMVKTPAEGKVIVYAHGCGHRTAALPEKVVEIRRTVANYEQYLRDLRKQFYEAYFRRTLDTRTAARLTQAALDRFNLPNMEG